ncbi:MAG: FAD-dependent oxidoreductase [Thermodesulfobacteriota bacterium]
MTKFFPRLFEPYNLGGMDLRNRLVMPAMCTNLALEDGTVSDRQLDYYETRARGGVGLIIVEAATIQSPVADGVRRHVRLDEDRFIAGLAGLTQAIKRNGAKVAAQIVHAGAAAISGLTGVEPVAPSAVPRPKGARPRPLSRKEIKDVVERFALAAGRAKAAGFDGVEVHAAHGYLISQFLSSYFNRRTDEYGGGLENRTRLLLEVLTAIREKAGHDFPVWFRLNGAEYGSAAGLTQDEAASVARLAEDSGAAAINVSLSSYEMNLRSGGPMAQKPGALSFLAENIKARVSIPVMSMGRHDPASAEQTLAKGQADLIVMGRRLIADPNLPDLAAAGRLEEIRPCLGCMTCLDCITVWHTEVRCAVNPAVGREREIELRPAAPKKKVLVIGGGPAGMEAARAAATRGHQVTLVEKGPALGGQLLVASVPPYKQSLGDFAAYQRRELDRLGVTVWLNRELRPGEIESFPAEAVIVATGSTPVVPRIPGLEKRGWAQAVDVLAGRAEVGDAVVVIGGALVGCETAEYLAHLGKQVTLVEILDDLALKLNPKQRDHLLARLDSHDRIETFVGVKEEKITAEGIEFSTREGERIRRPAETIVLAAGARPETVLAETPRAGGLPFRVIGDAVEVRDLAAAVTEGWREGLKA